MQIGFDNDKYLQTQSSHIKERIAQFGGKLYLEFGGKLFDDYHASRVLPGFAPDSKITMLKALRDQVEIVICPDPFRRAAFRHRIRKEAQGSGAQGLPPLSHLRLSLQYSADRQR